MAFRMHAARPRGGRGSPGPASPAAAGGTGWCPLSHERKRERSERFRIVAGDSGLERPGALAQRLLERRFENAQEALAWNAGRAESSEMGGRHRAVDE